MQKKDINLLYGFTVENNVVFNNNIANDIIIENRKNRKNEYNYSLKKGF